MMESRSAVRVLVVVAASLVLAATACGGLSLAGNGDEDADSTDGDAVGDGADLVDGVDGVPIDDGTPPGDILPSDDAGGDDGGTTSDGDGSTSHVIGIEPEGTEEYVIPVGGETIRPHRHAVPAALGAGAYVIVVDVERTPDSVAPSIGLYHFDRGTGVLRQAWLDDPDTTTEYNSVCWTGEAFVAALPTSRVGLRVVSLALDGSVLHGPVVLEPDAAYSPAGAGQPPAVLCASDGPFVIDHGRGAVGTDRLYALDADGAYGGSFVDADLPAFSTTPFYASPPCAPTGAEVACATPSGLVFVRRDGSYRTSDAVPAPGICPPGMGCDVVRTDDGLAATWAAVTTDRVALTFARFAAAGAVLVPPVSGPGIQTMRDLSIRAASSGATVLASGPGEDVDPLGPIQLYLFDTSGALLAPSLVAGVCSGHDPGAPDCPFPMGGTSTTPVFWEGDAYAALWVPEGPWAVGALAYRRFRLIEE